MKNQNLTSSFYYDILDLINKNNYSSAIEIIKNNLIFIHDTDQLSLALSCSGFLNYKIGDYKSSIHDFNKAIVLESNLDQLSLRSKDVSLSGRSNSKFKNEDYQGSIEDKRESRKLRLLEIKKFSEINCTKIDYKNILLGTYLEADFEPKYNILIKVSKIDKRKYDLIADYKKVIGANRKEQVIKKLELLSDSKYQNGDYKGSIKAIRRAERYY